GGTRVDAAHDAGHEPVATLHAVDGGGVVGGDGEGVHLRFGHDHGLGRIAEFGTGGVGVLAGDAAHGAAVSPVRGHVDLQDFLVQAEQLDGVGARGRRVAQHDDAGVVLAQAEFTLGADHAV